MMKCSSLPPISDLMSGRFAAASMISPNVVAAAPAAPQPQQQKRSSVKMKFTVEEDEKLIFLVNSNGNKNWNEIAEKMGTRNARQCRERWNNYINPELKCEPWTEEEDKLLVAKYNEYGSHWNKVARYFPKRSDNSIRNRCQLLIRHNERKSSSSSPSHGSDG